MCKKAPTVKTHELLEVHAKALLGIEALFLPEFRPHAARIFNRLMMETMKVHQKLVREAVSKAIEDVSPLLYTPDQYKIV